MRPVYELWTEWQMAVKVLRNLDTRAGVARFSRDALSRKGKNRAARWAGKVK